MLNKLKLFFDCAFYYMRNFSQFHKAHIGFIEFHKSMKYFLVVDAKKIKTLLSSMEDYPTMALSQLEQLKADRAMERVLRKNRSPSEKFGFGAVDDD